jgi:hypothetical protein
MNSGRTCEWSTTGATRRFVVATAIAVVATAAFLPGSGFGSPAAAARLGQMQIPPRLAAAIHARLGAGTIRSGSAARALPPGPNLGIAVALSADGTTALVGAPGVAGNIGAAYIFHATAAGSWSSSATPVATLSKHGLGKDLFGVAVALSADGMTAFVSAPLAGSSSVGAGAIYAFHASAEDAWSSSSTPAATLTANGAALLGFSLALSPDGTTLVAGAPFRNRLAGGAYVFHAASAGAWASTSTPTALLTYGAQSGGDLGVGFAVAISGDGTTVLVSDDGNSGGGDAYLYHAPAETAWASSSTPTAILSHAGSGTDDGLGGAVALSGDGTLALLGASGANSNTGAVDVFHSSGEAAWTSTSTPTAVLTNAAGSTGDGLGDNLAVSTDGTTALVLALGVSGRRGAAYIFRTSDEGAWVSTSAATATLTYGGARAKDLLGIGMLSSDGATALVGAPYVRLQTGAAYVFHASDASSWVSSATPNASLTDDALAACVVPKLKGLKLPVANAALAAGRCSLGRVTKVHSSSKHKKGRVLSQGRKPGRRLAINAKVGLRVGK